MKILVAVKGGPGSGNFGHSGRPGLVGGSTTSGGKITAADPIRGGTVEEQNLKWIDAETIKGHVVIKHSPAVTPDEAQIKGFIARRLPRMVHFGDPDKGIEEMAIRNVEHHASGYTYVDVEITPTEEQGIEWEQQAQYEEEQGIIREALYGE